MTYSDFISALIVLIDRHPGGGYVLRTQDGDPWAALLAIVIFWPNITALDEGRSVSPSPLTRRSQGRQRVFFLLRMSGQGAGMTYSDFRHALQFARRFIGRRIVLIDRTPRGGYKVRIKPCDPWAAVVALAMLWPNSTALDRGAENFWLTQRRIAELFGVEIQTISYHLKEIFDSGELDPGATIRKIRRVQVEGGREVERACLSFSLLGSPLPGEAAGHFSTEEVWITTYAMKCHGRTAADFLKKPLDSE